MTGCMSVCGVHTEWGMRRWTQGLVRCCACGGDRRVGSCTLLRNSARTPRFAGCTAQVPRVLRQNADRCLPDAGCAAVRDQGFPLLQRLPAQPVATGWQATAAGAALV